MRAKAKAKEQFSARVKEVNVEKVSGACSDLTGKISRLFGSKSKHER